MIKVSNTKLIYKKLRQPYMPKFEVALYTLTFEIRYALGYLYVDRCGQTLLDIEQELEGWYASIPDANSGLIHRPDKNLRAAFNSKKFDFTAERVDHRDFLTIAKEAANIWKIIHANLGLNDFTRLGFRLEYLLPTKTIYEAELKLKKSKLNIQVPDFFEKSNLNMKSRDITTVLARDDMEYRLHLSTTTRMEAVNPSSLIQGDTRAMSRKQNEVRLAQLNQLKNYSANPMYAIALDIDSVKYQPKTVSVEEHIINQKKTIEEYFLPILYELK